MPTMSSLNQTTRALGKCIRKQRRARKLSLDDVSLMVSEISSDVRIGVKTLELVEAGNTDAQLDHMIVLLGSVGIDMLVPGSQPATTAKGLLTTRLAEIRAALTEARHPPEQRKISFKAVSDVSGIEQGQIGKIESGDITPRFRTFLSLTRALGINVRFVQMAETPARATNTAARAATMRRGRRRSAQSAAA